MAEATWTSYLLWDAQVSFTHGVCGIAEFFKFNNRLFSWLSCRYRVKSFSFKAQLPEMSAHWCSWHGRSSCAITTSWALLTSINGIPWKEMRYSVELYSNGNGAISIISQNLTWVWARVSSIITAHLCVWPRAHVGSLICLVSNPGVWVGQMNNHRKPNSFLDRVGYNSPVTSQWKTFASTKSSSLRLPCGLLVALWHLSATPSRITSSNSKGEMGRWMDRMTKQVNAGMNEHYGAV